MGAFNASLLSEHLYRYLPNIRQKTWIHRLLEPGTTRPGDIGFQNVGSISGLLVVRPRVAPAKRYGFQVCC